MKKNNFVFALILISGLIIGGFLGDTLDKVPYLSWLSYGKEIGLTSPFVLDLSILKLQFGCTLNFTVSGIIGMILSIFIYKKL